MPFTVEFPYCHLTSSRGFAHRRIRINKATAYGLHPPYPAMSIAVVLARVAASSRFAITVAISVVVVVIYSRMQNTKQWCKIVLPLL